MSINKALFSSDKMDWETPDDLFKPLHREFRFDCDAAARKDNSKCFRFIGPETDSLTSAWSEYGARFWLNPPYGRQLKYWIAKAAAEAKKGCFVVCLIPARTDTKYWHEHIWDLNTHRPRPGVQVRFLKGRVKFKGAENGAPFPSAVVIFSPFGVDL